MKMSRNNLNDISQEEKETIETLNNRFLVSSMLQKFQDEKLEEEKMIV
jgi:hypothetical protein